MQDLVNNFVSGLILIFERSIQVGDTYGSEVNKVMELLLDCAKSHQKILVSPAPYVLFRDFGNSGLQFELRYWTSN